MRIICAYKQNNVRITTDASIVRITTDANNVRIKDHVGTCQRVNVVRAGDGVKDEVRCAACPERDDVGEKLWTDGTPGGRVVRLEETLNEEREERVPAVKLEQRAVDKVVVLVPVQRLVPDEQEGGEKQNERESK